MTEQWKKLKETITEMRDNGGIGRQQEVCKFLVNYMEILEKQMQEPILDKIRAEIIELPTISFNANDVYKADVLQIIDKYKAESENNMVAIKHFSMPSCCDNEPQEARDKE